MSEGQHSRAAQSDEAGEHALLVYDDECDFCRRWVARWQRMAGPGIESVPAREAPARVPGLSPAELAKAIHLVEPGGHISKGAEAVVRALARAGRGWFPLWLYRKVPGMAGGMEFMYRLVARHRHRG